eukprot:scaffold1048_cov224-Pinguiococcus_pyrenoidosus.AAC.4
MRAAATDFIVRLSSFIRVDAKLNSLYFAWFAALLVSLWYTISISHLVLSNAQRQCFVANVDERWPNRTFRKTKVKDLP